MHCNEDPKSKTENQELMVRYSDKRGTSQARIPLTGLAAFILNSVNKPGAGPLVEESRETA
jgi:hypothetical protein